MLTLIRLKTLKMKSTKVQTHAQFGSNCSNIWIETTFACIVVLNLRHESNLGFWTFCINYYYFGACSKTSISINK